MMKIPPIINYVRGCDRTTVVTMLSRQSHLFLRSKVWNDLNGMDLLRLQKKT